jgi:hypothetical protein
MGTRSTLDHWVQQVGRALVKLGSSLLSARGGSLAEATKPGCVGRSCKAPATAMTTGGSPAPRKSSLMAYALGYGLTAPKADRISR